MSVLAADTTRAVDARNEPWGHSPESFRDRELIAGRFSVFRRPASGAWNQGTAAPDRGFGLDDEESKLNVLVTPSEVLGRLPEFPRSLLWVIETWQDRQDSPAAGQQASWSPSLTELAAQAGLSRSATARISRLVTTHGDGKLNINTVSPEVLGALGYSASLRTMIMSFREGADQMAGTADDGVFTDPDAIAAALAEAASLSPLDAAEASRLQATGDFVVFSSNFRVLATGEAARGPGRVTIEAVVQRSASGPPVIVEWFES
jgi:hypothetical protein